MHICALLQSSMDFNLHSFVMRIINLIFFYSVRLPYSTMWQLALVIVLFVSLEGKTVHESAKTQVCTTFHSALYGGDGVG